MRRLTCTCNAYVPRAALKPPSRGEVCARNFSTRRADSLSQTSSASRALWTASSTAGGSSLSAIAPPAVRLRGCEAVGTWTWYMDMVGVCVGTTQGVEAGSRCDAGTG